MSSKSNPNSNLVWLDLEMTGLNPHQDTILEIATIITDSDLKTLEEGPVYAIQQPQKVLGNMDEWNTSHHTSSGLIEKCLKSNITMRNAEELTLGFVKKYIAVKDSPLCGNSIGQDRRFLDKYMNTFNEFLHYRNIDVSTIKELSNRWFPKLPPFEKKNLHIAMEDIRESINELKYFREKLFTLA